MIEHLALRIKFMESLVLPHGQKQNFQTPGRKFLSSGSHKDLWLIVREGSLTDVDSALAILKKNGVISIQETYLV